MLECQIVRHLHRCPRLSQTLDRQILSPDRVREGECAR